MEALLIAFLLGFKHATDGDHLLATSNFVARSRNVRDAIKVGMSWSFGHQTTALPLVMLLIFLGFRLLPREFPVEHLVASTLMVIGSLSLLSEVGLVRAIVHEHPHLHPPRFLHHHPHVHRLWPLSRIFHAIHVHKHHRAAYAIGLVHGLASNDELFMTFSVLFLAEVRNFDSIIFVTGLSSFTSGVMLGMLLFMAMLFYGLQRTGTKGLALLRSCRIAIAVITVGYGVSMLAGYEGMNLLESIIGRPYS